MNLTFAALYRRTQRTKAHRERVERLKRRLDRIIDRAIERQPDLTENDAVKVLSELRRKYSLLTDDDW